MQILFILSFWVVFAKSSEELQYIAFSKSKRRLNIILFFLRTIIWRIDRVAYGAVLLKQRGN